MEKPLEKIITDGGFTAIFRKMGFVGDSLSSGEFVSYMNDVKDWHDMYEYSWGQFIARKCSLTAYNFSMGGMTARKFKEFAYHCGFFDKEKVCPAYVIALGVNDMYHLYDDPNYGFGSMDDVDFNDYRNNKETFVGDYVRIIQEIREMQPKARIFVVTMPREPLDYYDDKRVPEDFDRHAEFLRKLPDYFEFLYVIDLRKYDVVYDDEFKKTYYLDDHMNPMGYLYVANVISSYIDYIIRHNPDDFKQVGFIGKSLYNSKEKW